MRKIGIHKTIAYLPMLALAGLLLVSLNTGCARDRFNGRDTQSGRGASSDMASYSRTIPPPPANSGSMNQKLCPVTGEPLDSMGGPIPVSTDGGKIYVCCQGCVKAVKKDPQKYLAIVHGES